MGGPPLPQSKFNITDGRHLENKYDVIFPPWVGGPIRTKFADYGNMVKIETGSKTTLLRLPY